MDWHVVVNRLTTDYGYYAMATEISALRPRDLSHNSMLAFVYHEATVTSIQWVQHTLAKVRMEDPVAMKSAWTVLPGLARMILTICCLICTAVFAISVA